MDRKEVESSTQENSGEEVPVHRREDHWRYFGDARAISEAAGRPSMRFGSSRNAAQQTVSALHRIRERPVRERTATVNQIHRFPLELGVSLPRGTALLGRLSAVLSREPPPPRLVALVVRLGEHVRHLEEQTRQVEQELMAALRADDKSPRLLEIPGIGPIEAPRRDPCPGGTYTPINRRAVECHQSLSHSE